MSYTLEPFTEKDVPDLGADILQNLDIRHQSVSGKILPDGYRIVRKF